jgi:hypothetical protein
MAIYSRADRTSNVTTAAACYEIRTTSTDRPKIMEIGISLVTAAATVIGIGRPQAIGVGPTSAVIVQAEDTGDPAGTIVTCMAWGTTAPTVPLQYFRRWSFPGTVGAGVIFTFPRGLIVPISSSLVFWNILGGATLDVHVVIDE